MKGIFLDDERMPNQVPWMLYPCGDIVWHIARTFEEFQHLVLHDTFDVVSFDHDLQDFDVNGREYTGMDCLKFLINKHLAENVFLPICYFHSQNPIGRDNMQALYHNAINYFDQIG